MTTGGNISPASLRDAWKQSEVSSEGLGGFSFYLCFFFFRCRVCGRNDENQQLPNYSLPLFLIPIFFEWLHPTSSSYSQVYNLLLIRFYIPRPFSIASIFLLDLICLRINEMSPNYSEFAPSKIPFFCLSFVSPFFFTVAILSVLGIYPSTFTYFEMRRIKVMIKTLSDFFYSLVIWE